jgi:hypothetical protein
MGTILIWGYVGTKRLRTPEVDNGSTTRASCFKLSSWNSFFLILKTIVVFIIAKIILK